jgi:hypothetical protein
VDGEGNRLLELDRAGRVLSSLNMAAGGCRLPHSLAAAPDGCVYVGDLAGSNVQKWAVPAPRSSQ